jgi:hypothetical protein
MSDSVMTPAKRPISVDLVDAPSQANIASSSISPKIVQTMPEPREWNTRNLGLRLCTDLASAASAAVLVAPLITMIDKFVFP